MDDGQWTTGLYDFYPFYDLASVALFTLMGLRFLFLPLTGYSWWFSNSPRLGSHSGLGCWLQRAGRVPSLTFSDERLGVAVLYILSPVMLLIPLPLFPLRITVY